MDLKTDNKAILPTMEPETSDVVEHFTARAGQYDRSSSWCTDPEMMQRMVELAAPRSTDLILDVACGTGLVSEAFRGKVAQIVGIDLTPAMTSHALNRVDTLVLGAAESLPFSDEQFDLTTCRQGIQFMDAALAVKEMVRVTKKNGRVIIISLCAYGEEDRKEYFEILHLRNPARRNFFVPAELSQLLQEAGCREVHVHNYVSDENIDVWSDNGAIPETNRERIRAIYRDASTKFRRLHQLQYLDDGHIIDRMLFVLAVGIP